MKEYGERLKTALIWKGMTQRKLAQILNVDASAVSEWVNNKTYPTLEKFYRICLILDETPNYFLGFEN